MSIHIRPEAHQKKHEMSGNKFAAIKGHRSIIDVDKIKRENHERLLKSVSDGVNALGDVIRNHAAKQKAAKLLSEEN